MIEKLMEVSQTPKIVLSRRLNEKGNMIVDLIEENDLQRTKCVY